MYNSNNTIHLCDHICLRYPNNIACNSKNPKVSSNFPQR